MKRSFKKMAFFGGVLHYYCVLSPWMELALTLTLSPRKYTDDCPLVTSRHGGEILEKTHHNVCLGFFGGGREGGCTQFCAWP